MRIAFISAMQGSPWGGSEVLWSQSAQRLHAQGHPVLVSVPRWPKTPQPIEALRSQGVEVHERQWSSASLLARGFARATGRARPDPGWEPSWARIVGFRPDLVCISHGGTVCGVDWMVRCLRAGIPYVSVAQANAEAWWPADDQRGQIIEAYAGAAKAYFVSQANWRLLERQLGVALPHGQVVWNPFNVPWEPKRTWPAATQEFALACVGRLEPAAKGQDLLFQVLARPHWRNRPLRVSLFGQGKWEQGLRQLAHSLRLSSQIRFCGHVEDIASVWADHHALVLPSRHEGLPLCLVEAMLCGRFGIVTDVGGNREPVADGVNGFIAAAPTVSLLDDAMERAWSRRTHWAEIGEAASRSIRSALPPDPARAFAYQLLRLQPEGRSGQKKHGSTEPTIT